MREIVMNTTMTKKGEKERQEKGLRVNRKRKKGE